MGICEVRDGNETTTIISSSQSESQKDKDKRLFDLSSISECLTVTIHEYDLERSKKQSFDNRAGIIITVFSAIGFVIYDKIPLKLLLNMISQPLTFIILMNIIIIISIYLSLIVSFYYAIRIISVRGTENFDINIINQDFISCAKIDSVSKMLEIYFGLVQSHRSRNEDISKKLVKSQWAMVISIILIFLYLAFK